MFRFWPAVRKDDTHGNGSRPRKKRGKIEVRHLGFGQERKDLGV